MALSAEGDVEDDSYGVQLLADIKGFWGPLLSLLDHMRENGFVRRDLPVSYLVAQRSEDIIPMLREDMRRTALSGTEQTTLDLPV